MFNRNLKLKILRRSYFILTEDKSAFGKIYLSQNIFKLISLLQFMESGGHEHEIARIKKVGVLSMGLMTCLINFFLGIIFSVVMLILIISFGSYLSSIPGVMVNVSGYSSILIVFPFVNAILGFVGGVVFAWIYNLSAKIGKGIKLYSD